MINKKTSIPGQVDYAWVKDKVENWCESIPETDVLESENDFEWEGRWYRPSDLFRKKVLGEFPKVTDDVLIPLSWIEAAQERWKNYRPGDHNFSRLGYDVAGMGRDCSVKCERLESGYVTFWKKNSGGQANHMETAGQVIHDMTARTGCIAFIDTIGEGAGVFSRVQEVGKQRDDYMLLMNVVSCKYSEAARTGAGKPMKDVTGQYEFANMRAYLFWCVRDWLNPDNHTGAMLPPDGTLAQEATEIRWSFMSTGKIIIEPKEDIKKRLGFSTDEFDALANTFYPQDAVRGETFGDIYSEEDIY